MIYYDLTYIDNNNVEQTTTIEYSSEPQDPEQFAVDLQTQLGYAPAITVVFRRDE